ncbi:hypothetical protein RB597_002670 [Gaeumannomyces tritici]
MAANSETPNREATPSAPAPGAAASPSARAGTPPASSIPQKRAMVEDDHAPAVRSPLNPDAARTQATATRAQSQTRDESPVLAREKRTKKESLKKREAKASAAGVSSGGDSARATPDPKLKDQQPDHPNASPMRYKPSGPLKRSDFEPSRDPVLISHHKIPGLDGEEIEFFDTSEQALNRKNYVYNYCIADPRFPSSRYYRQTEPPPYTAHLSLEDAPQGVFFDREARHITGEQGFRMARANVAVREGRWYWECKVVRGVLPPQPAGADDTNGDTKAAAAPTSRGHVRMGWARREASRDAPVGLDAYSYGLRDVGGQKVHMSRPRDFFPAGEDVREGDVIGLEISLPSEQLHRKVVLGHYNPVVDVDHHLPGGDEATEGANIVRDRVPFRGKTHMIYFEKFDYHPTKELEDLMNPSPMAAAAAHGSHLSEKPNPNHPVTCLRTLPGSYVKIYKNGVPMGTAFEDLLSFLPPASTPNAKLQEGAREGFDDGTLGYYPAVSVFRGGAAEVNFGPDFWYPPPGFRAEAPLPDGDVDMVDADGAGAQETPAAAPSVKLRPMADRFDEQIVEDVLYDIVDEVDFWMQDGGKVVDKALSDAEGRDPMQED